MLFNPIKYREQGFSDEAINSLLSETYDANAPMGNFALYDISSYIYSVLVGVQDRLAPLLPRAAEWIDLAIARKEVFGGNPDMYRSELSHGRAIAGWLQDGQIHERCWDEARIFGEAAWRNAARPWTRHEIVNGGALDDYMAFSCLAGPDYWEAGIEMYQRWMGEQRKVNLAGAISPRKFAYALCLQNIGRLSMSSDSLWEAGRRMLRANLEENWLGSGQAIRAATWLLVVHGLRNSRLDPVQTLLSAYDDMPNVVRHPY